MLQGLLLFCEDIILFFFPKMLYSKLNNGVRFPKLGVGTYRLRGLETETIVAAAINVGYRLIDTAKVYYNESCIGKVLAEKIPNSIKREDIFVTSKLGPDDLGAEKTRKAAVESLQALGLEYLDLYLIHWPAVSGVRSDSDVHSKLRRESWLEIEKMYNEGMFKSIGISNYTVKHLEELMSYCTIKPAVLQIELHPYLTQTALREYCFISDIHVQAYSSLGANDGCKELLEDLAVKTVAVETGKTPAQVLLCWAIQQGISVIPKTRKVERLKENHDIFDFQLSDEQMLVLNQLNQDKHFCWDAGNVK